MMEWSVISAVNDKSVLGRCLLSSPDIARARDLILQSGCRSAAAAYNAGIGEARTDLLVLVHQDVYLPEGWISSLRRAVARLSTQDPEWGVLGVWGVLRSGEGRGFLYCGANRRILGRAFEGGAEVETLDEVLLVVRKSSGLRFDERLAGFHMYGADICMEARRQGRRNYAIGAFCIHNTNQHGMLPLAFWRGYLGMRRKWRAQLPIKTTCTEITRWCWPMVRWNVVRAINLATGRDKPPTKRVSDPAPLYEELVAAGVVQPAGNRLSDSR
jgi:hypothetical protein